VLSELLASAPVYRHVWTLVHPFHRLLTHRRGQALPAWIQAAETRGVPELVRFAKGLTDDIDAVQAGVTEHWSQGMTEGFNNPIQWLKRVLYGRAHFDWLRARIVHNQS
jgi:transposase